MGIWDSISSTTEAVKRNAPAVPTAVKAACETSYGYCSAAAGKVDSAVRVNGIQRLYGYVSNEENRSQIGLFASKFAQNAAYYAVRESYKLVPGGKVMGEIISGTINDVKSEKHSKQEVDARKQIIGGGIGKNSVAKNLLDRADMHSGKVELAYEKRPPSAAATTTANQTPEDVLRIFMMKEFMGNRFSEDLVLPQIKNGNKSK